MKIWNVVVEIVDFLGAPQPFSFILTIILGSWFVFLIFLLLFFPIFYLFRLLSGHS